MQKLMLQLLLLLWLWHWCKLISAIRCHYSSWLEDIESEIGRGWWHVCGSSKP